jgi:probable F420-dependent oxidoreductase
VRIGIFSLLTSAIATRSYVEAVGAAADTCGFHSLWIGEHVVLFDEYASKYPYSGDGELHLPRSAGMLEPLTTLSFLAACTTRIRLGTGIYILPQHNPVETAKQVAGLDWLSEGRVDLGLGLGWSREEFAALGAPWPNRARRMEDYLEVMRRLWRDEVAEFKSEFYQLPPCRLDPKPLQRPAPPIYFGGNSEAALRRVVRQGDGWLALGLSPQELSAGVQTLRLFALDAQRNPDTIDITVLPGAAPLDRASMDAYREAGAGQVVASAFGRTPDEVRKSIEQHAERFLVHA